MKRAVCQKLNAPPRSQDSGAAQGMPTLVSHAGKPLRGRVRVPGDKSIAHRALILAALAAGVSRLRGLPDSADVAATRAALTALGVPIRDDGALTSVSGRGLGGLRPPRHTLDFGNAGTGLRLLLGALAAHSFAVEVTGDASLVERPQAPLLEPLRRMGASVSPAGANTLPLTFKGSAETVPITHALTAPSAQVKSAILLAGLHTMGATTVIEKTPTRDHTEILLKQFGAAVDVQKENGARRVSVSGWRELRPTAVDVPGDASAAAFVLGAAALVPGSDVTIENAGLNPTRTGFVRVLKRMGAAVEISHRRTASGEARGALRVRHAKLRAVTTAAAEAASLIDEFPILFALAAAAKGASRFEGLGRLREKESDRLLAMARALAANGVEAVVSGDDLTIAGSGIVPGGGCIDAALDHRVAMAMSVLGLAAAKPVRVGGAETIATSFPGFVKVMRGLGAGITVEREAEP
jgi:3-phosphoshikimate 1-carboxyvinyltransferase